MAAGKGHAECAKLLIPLSDPKDNSWDWALADAARNGHAECLGLLVPLTDLKNDKLTSVLDDAVAGGSAECVKLLIPAQAQRQARNCRAIAQAIVNEKTELAELLLFAPGGPFEPADVSKFRGLSLKTKAGMTRLVEEWAASLPPAISDISASLRERRSPPARPSKNILDLT